MKPSLYSLYKRGKYYRPPSIDRGDRNEVERFSVAAVAFCLEYDRDFRKHFWNNVCNQTGDLDLGTAASIEIEERNWSDLKITNGDCLAVVEFKAGAPLDKKQNPMKDAFWGEKGYGWEMLQIQRSQKLRRCFYTILGYGGKLRFVNGTLLRPRHRRVQELKMGRSEGIVCAHQLWSVLVDGEGFSASKLVQDLFNCLGILNIKEFQLMSVRKIHIKPTELTATAANVIRVIDQLKSTFGLKGKYDSSVESDESWWLGFDITGAKKIKQQMPTDGAWFGFESDTKSGHQRSVYLYGADRIQANKIKRSFKKPFLCDMEKDDAGLNLIITESDAKDADYEWFASVFRKLGLKD